MSDFQTVTCRFGQIEAPPESILRVDQEPLLGFERLTEFVLVNLEEQRPFLWLQSMQDGSVAFPLLDPSHYFSGYTREVSQAVGPDWQVLCMVGREGQQLGLNLLAPILIAPHSGKLRQHMIANRSWDVFHSFQMAAAC
jgi:flagellar assembly factor FliW